MKFEIAVPIYKTWVIVMIGVTDDECDKFMKKYHVNEKDRQIMNFGEETTARCLLLESRLCFVRFRENPTISCVAHEMLHCTFEILRRVGVYHSFKSEESYTYLLEYLINQFDIKTKRYGKL